MSASAERLEKIERGLDQLFRQNLAILEAISRLAMAGGLELSSLEAAGSDRLDQIEAKLDTLIDMMDED